MYNKCVKKITNGKAAGKSVRAFMDCIFLEGLKKPRKQQISPSSACCWLICLLCMLFNSKMGAERSSKGQYTSTSLHGVTSKTVVVSYVSSSFLCTCCLAMFVPYYIRMFSFSHIQFFVLFFLFLLSYLCVFLQLLIFLRFILSDELGHLALSLFLYYAYHVLHFLYFLHKS
jgi:hypothetical protein